MCLLRFATVEQSLLQTLQKVLPSCTGLWSARLVLLENSFPQISQGKLYCGGPHARAASKWSRNKTALERVQNLYYCLFDRLQDTSFRVGYFQVSIQVGPCWLDFSTDCAGGLAIMYCLVVGQTLRTFKSLVTLRALVEPLLFIGASQIWTATGKKPIVHACWKIYIAPSDIQLVVKLWIRAALQGYL